MQQTKNLNTVLTGTFFLQNMSYQIRVLKCNLYFKSVYQLQETQATKALGRLLARISKCLSKTAISARPDLATNVLQILIPATTNCLVCPKGQYTSQLCLGRWFVKKIFHQCTPKVKIENFSKKFLPVRTGFFFRKLPVQKTGGTGPG